MQGPQSPSRNVTIREVYPHHPAPEGEPPTVRNPNLITLPAGVDADVLNNMVLRPPKRRRADPSCIEMRATANGQEWRGQRGFHELNVDYFVGVVNKKTGDMDLYEVDGSYRLRPSRRSGLTESGDEEDEAEEERTYAEKRNDLLNEFGGKKSIQRAAKYQRDKITEDKVDEKTAFNINQAAKEMRARDAEKGISHTIVQTTEAMAPPHDNAATNVWDAYPLLGMLSPLEMSALEQEAAAMIELSDESGLHENPGWTPLVWDILRLVIGRKESNASIRNTRLQAAMHLHYLIVLAKGPISVLNKERRNFMESMAVDGAVLDKLLERYTTRKVRVADKRSCRIRTSDDATKIVIYGIVMWLTASGFKDCRRLGELADALSVSFKLLLKHAQGLGCRVLKSKDRYGPNAYSITLTVPLKFKAISQRQGRPEARA